MRNGRDEGGEPFAARGRHVTGSDYRRHTHTCPSCGAETDFTSEHTEDGEPLHCRVCLELELGGSADVELCPGCWEEVIERLNQADEK